MSKPICTSFGDECVTHVISENREPTKSEIFSFLAQVKPNETRIYVNVIDSVLDFGIVVAKNSKSSVTSSAQLKEIVDIYFDMLSVVDFYVQNGLTQSVRRYTINDFTDKVVMASMFINTATYQNQLDQYTTPVSSVQPKPKKQFLQL